MNSIPAPVPIIGAIRADLHRILALDFEFIPQLFGTGHGCKWDE
jgi:hypothetical protein